MNKYYVYAHYRISGKKNIPFYIGKGTGNRHISKRRNKYWKNVVEKNGFRVEILMDNMDEKSAYLYEIEMIFKYKKLGGCECNFTLGGDGVRVENRWWNKKISDSLTGKKRPSGKNSKSYKNVITKEELYHLYIEKKMSSISISKLKNISYGTICCRLKQFGIDVRKPSKSPIKVYCINNDTIYNSINDAARELNLFRENIRKVLKGKYKKTGGYSFKKI